MRKELPDTAENAKCSFVLYGSRRFLTSPPTVNPVMRAAIASYDWAKTPLGPRDRWPATLETLVRLVLDTRFAMLIMYGPDLIQIYNDGYVPIFGDKHPRSLGQPARESWHDIWSDIGELLMGVYERGDAVYFENLPLKMQRHGGYEDAYFTFTYSPIRESDTVRGILCVVSETTAHILREREMAERAEALAALDRAKTEFFNNVSHEFRTPLTLMLGPLEELARTLPEYEQRYSADLARRNAIRLQKLVNMLLDFAAAQSGVAKANRAMLDADSVTRDLAGEFRSAFERAGLYLHLDAQAAHPVPLDPAMYEKIVLNLLSNALKFTFQGGVRVETRREGDEFVLRVRDTGIGISEADRATLFDRFSRVRGARSRTHEGTGIGLALVQELISLHNGSIQVDSVPGAGSTFTVRFPLAAHVDAAEAPVNTAELRRQYREEADAFTGGAAPEPVPAAPAGAPRLLIADDNADLRGYLARLFAGRYHVALAADGNELLTLAGTLKPDLIVSDVMMPHVDGFEVLRRLRADPDLSGTPVILLTARAGEESSADGLTRGADDYIVKPFVAADLLARVEALLRRSRAGGAAVLQTRRPYDALMSAIADQLIAAPDTVSVWRSATAVLTRDFAEWAVVYVPMPDGIIKAASLRHVEPAKTELGYAIEREFPQRVADGSPVSHVLITGEPLLMRGFDVDKVSQAVHEGRATVLQTLNLRSFVLAPVLVDGVPVAVVGAVRDAGRPDFDEQDLAFVERFSARCALAFENARTQEQQRTIAVTLQRALLPTALPVVPGLKFSASYRPAQHESLVGGDWYDAFTTYAGRVVVSIGDVVGHGFGAAGAMAMLRHAVRSLAMESDDPADILQSLNRLMIAEQPGNLATCIVASIDPQTLECSVASAGHLPVVKLDGEEERELLAPRGLMLGIDAAATYPASRYVLEPRDFLAFLTDGFVENERNMAEGEERLIGALRTARHALDPATAVHLAIFGGEAPRDDTAMLTISVEDALPSLDMALPAEPRSAGLARGALRRFLKGTGLDDARCSDVLVAVGEAVINAIEHAYPAGGSGVVRLAAALEEGRAVIDVQDEGGAWNIEERDPIQRGYGLPLMYALCDSVEIERNLSGTRVRMTAAVPARTVA